MNDNKNHDAPPPVVMYELQHSARLNDPRPEVRAGMMTDELVGLVERANEQIVAKESTVTNDPPPYVPPSLREAKRHREARATAGVVPGVTTHTPYDVDNIYTYHPPIGDQARRYGELRNSAKAHAELVLKLVPASAERTLALRRLEECFMWSAAAIARNEGPGDDEAGDEEGPTP